MNDNYPKIDIDELISLYLDGEASERQQTELKRLMQRDPSIADRLAAFKTQQQVLNRLPMETAPVTLADDIRAQMERKLILADTPGQSPSVLAAGHLAIRRLMATAAMILVPLGILVLVVFEIMKPPAGGPADYTPAGSIVQNDTPAQTPATPVAAATELPFNGTLILGTDDYMAVNEQVRRAIEDQGLLAGTFPDRTADKMRFQITASPDRVIDLLDSLAAVRGQCRRVVLQVNDRPESDSLIEIPDVKDKQLRMLLYEDSPQMFDRLATRYAAANRKTDPLFEEAPDLNPDGYPEPSIPTLAGTYDTADKTIKLTIQVERADN